MKIKDPFYYVQGNLRYQLYYSKFKFLIRDHILDQIDWRIAMMNQTCYDQGSCVECGCVTTALQMSDKACDGMCYPPMMNEKDLRKFVEEGETVNGWKYRVERKRGWNSKEGLFAEEDHFIFFDGKIVNSKNTKKYIGDGK